MLYSSALKTQLEMFSKCAHYKNRSPPERKWIICQIPRTHVLETYKGLVYSHYKENVNGNFDQCTKEVLAVLQTEESSQSEEEAK